MSVEEITDSISQLKVEEEIEIFKKNRSAKIIQNYYRNKKKIDEIKEMLLTEAENISKSKMGVTEKGSLKFLLKGPEPSDQSISIKFGKVGEKMFKIMIKSNPTLELLKCGVQVINEKGKKKDLDLIWIDKNKKILYYREAKGNIELDTEKLPAMISKIKNEISNFISEKYPDYTSNIGIICWSVYNRNDLKKGITQIKKCEGQEIKVDHVEDILKLTNIIWDEESFYSFMKEDIGKILFNNS